MSVSLWNNVKYKKVYNTVNFDDINTFLPPLEIADGQATDLRNLSSSRFPALKVRNGKTQISTALTTPNGLGQRNNQYVHYVDAKAWKYWNGSSLVAVKTLSTDATGTFEEFNTGTIKYTIFANGTDKEAWDGTTVTALTNAPASKIFTTHKGRIYWALGTQLKYSALNVINDYTTANDAGAIDVTRAQGSITALHEFTDRVWIFTESGMHGLYGTSPSNFELIDTEGNVGCFSDLSVVKVNKKLYWATFDGIYEFDGSTPIKVSEPYSGNGVNGGVTTFIKGINKTYKTLVCSGSFGDLLYVSIPYSATATANNLTLVFDTKLRKWFIRDEGFVNFVTINNILYGVDTAGKLWDMTTDATLDGATAISWYWISKSFSEGSPSSQLTTSDIWLSFKLPIGSTLTLAYSDAVTGTSFTDILTYTANASEQVQRAILPVTALQRVNWRRLKLYGTGDCEVYFMEQKGRMAFSRR
jgi:hypothetical protein